MAEKSSGNPRQYPTCTAIVLCDRVKRDESTGRKTIKGTFDRLVAPKEQPITVRFQVYCELTDGLGTVPLEIHIVDAETGVVDDESIIFKSKVVANFPHQLKTTTSVFEVRTTFPQPGVYRCVLKSDDHEIVAKRIIINESEKR